MDIYIGLKVLLPWSYARVLWTEVLIVDELEQHAMLTPIRDAPRVPAELGDLLRQAVGFRRHCLLSSSRQECCPVCYYASQ